MLYDKRIELDLTKITFDEVEDVNSGDLWQKRAAQQLLDNLANVGEQARKYREKRSHSQVTIKINAIHDAIFISGGRGAGKTVFLNSAKQIWEQREELIQPTITPNLKLHFAPSIDPTLLVDHDDFTNVVVAHLYNEVEDKLRLNRSHSEQEKINFYNKLKDLANALGQESDYKDHIGIDRVIKYRSGIQVERHFHDYVDTCCKILNVDAIVLPIDDVDMALDRAFEVLDVVRRMLACPFVLPLISGDEQLYQHVMRRHFNETISNKHTYDESRPIANNLSNAYLTKVLPNNLRIDLLPIDSLSKQLIISEHSDSDNFSYIDYSQKFEKHFFPFVNGLEKSADYPKPSNAREVTQFVSTFSPSTFKEDRDWGAFKNWALLKQHGLTYNIATTAQELEECTFIRSLGDYELFNPKLQFEQNLPWAEKDFYSDQEGALSSLKGIGNQVDMLNQLREQKNSCSMPVLEFYTTKFAVSNDELKQDKSSLLINIYTHRDYYGKSSSQIHQVFFSRAFDILVTSLFEEDKQTINFKGTVDYILSKAPFYSVYAVVPTKYFATEEVTPTDEGELQEENSENTDLDFINDFAMSLKSWNEKHSEVLTTFRKKLPLSLIHSVFNKTFTQLHVLREKGNDLKNEYLTTVVKRFEYIVINAFASFLKPQHLVVNANIAQTPNIENIVNYKNFIRYDTAYVRNVEHFIGKKDEQGNIPRAEKDDTIEKALLRAVCDHPLFKLVKDNAPSLYRLRDSDNKPGAEVKTPQPKYLQSVVNTRKELGLKSVHDVLKYIKNDSTAKENLKKKILTEIKSKKLKVDHLGAGYIRLCSELEIV